MHQPRTPHPTTEPSPLCASPRCDQERYRSLQTGSLPVSETNAGPQLCSSGCWLGSTKRQDSVRNSAYVWTERRFPWAMQNNGVSVQARNFLDAPQLGIAFTVSVARELGLSNSASKGGITTISEAEERGHGQIEGRILALLTTKGGQNRLAIGSLRKQRTVIWTSNA